MKSGFRYLVILGALFAAGFGLGKLLPPAKAEAEEKEKKVRPASVRVPLVGAVQLPEIFDQLAGLTGAEFPAELERRIDGGLSAEKDIFAFALRWVMADAEGGADYLLEMIGEDDDEEAERYYDIFELFFYAWAKQDPDGFYAYVKKMELEEHPLAEDLVEIGEEFAGVEASIEEAKAFLAALDPANTDADTDRARQMLIRLAKSDPESAATMLDKFLGHHRGNAIWDLGREWGAIDPEAALEWAAGLKGIDDKARGLQAVMNQLIVSDFEMAVARFERYREALVTSSTANAIIRKKAEKEGALAAFRWYHDQIESIEGRAHLNIWDSLSKVNQIMPRGAAELRVFLEGLPEGALKHWVGLHVVNESRIDLAGSPEQFLAEIGEMPKDKLQGQLLAGGLRGWIALDPVGMREAIAQMEEGQRSEVARKVLAMGGAFSDLSEVVDFARAHAIDVDSMKLGDAGLTEWSDHASAADFFSGAAGFEVESGAGKFVYSWAASSPEEALGWAGQHLEEHPEIAASLINGWVHSDPEAASEWALGLDDPVARGASAEAISKAVLYKDPEAAFAWALEAPVGLQREELLRHAYLTWRARAKEAADQALRGDGVPDELREIFLEE